MLVVFFSITADGFLSLTNFQAVAANMTLLLVMAIGQTFVIVMGMALWFFWAEHYADFRPAKGRAAAS